MPPGYANATDIARKIYAELVEGKAPGTVLLTQRELGDEYNAHRTTIVHALNYLAERGWIRANDNGRFVVCDKRKHVDVVTRPSPSSQRFAADIADDPDAKTWSAPVLQQRVPDEWIARLLGLRRNQTVVVHCQDRLINGEPTGIAETYLSKLVAAIPHIAATRQETDMDAAISAAGILIARATDRTGLEIPTPAQRTAWKIPLEQNVLQTRRVVWGENDNVVYVRVTSLNGDLHVFEHNITRTDLEVTREDLVAKPRTSKE